MSVVPLFYVPLNRKSLLYSKRSGQFKDIYTSTGARAQTKARQPINEAIFIVFYIIRTYATHIFNHKLTTYGIKALRVYIVAAVATARRMVTQRSNRFSIAINNYLVMGYCYTSNC